MTCINSLVTSNASHRLTSTEIVLSDEKGNSKLHFFMSCFDMNPEDNADSVVELLEKGVDPNQLNYDGYTPLHLA